MNLKELMYSLSSVREKQIKKILKYGKEILNIEVEIKEPQKGNCQSGGYIAPEGNKKAKVLVVNEYRGLNLVFILLHEFGHHIDFLKRGYIPEEEDAYQYYPDSKDEAPCPEKYKKVIRFIEEEANKYAQELAIYLDLKLPRYSSLKDLIYDRKILEIQLEKGFTNQTTRLKIRKLASGEARRIVDAENRKRTNNS